MAGNARSIRLCFDDPLPEYAYSGSKYVAKDGGESTHNTAPPLFAIPRNHVDNHNANNRWADLGDLYLTTTLRQRVIDLQSEMETKVRAKQVSFEDAQTRVQAAQTALDAIDREYIYRKEDVISHGNESDVVRTAALYLLHPISQVLWAHWDYRHTFCNKGERTLKDVRADISFWKAVTQGGQNFTRAFAVVEFKRRTMIRLDEFEKALRRRNPWPQGYDHSDSNHRQQANRLARGYSSTAFQDGSFFLIKQAASYAIKYRTRYIALYNYELLICCYFSQLDPSLSRQQLINTGVGDFVEFDIYPFVDKHGNDVSRDMRRALLGFLEEALVETPP